MLFKWILLLVIAWYITKAFGNLITYLRGDVYPPSNPIEPTRSRNTVHVHKPADRDPVRQRAQEIEDARFKDLD